MVIMRELTGGIYPATGDQGGGRRCDRHDTLLQRERDSPDRGQGLRSPPKRRKKVPAWIRPTSLTSCLWRKVVEEVGEELPGGAVPYAGGQLR